MTGGIAFLFPGQGCQTVGMGKFLYDEFPDTRRTFEEADAALGESLSELLWSGPAEKLKETANAQPAILTVSVAVGRWLFAHGVRPDIMAGHSLGEYSALVMAGAVSFSDAVKLVRYRGQYMQEAVPLGTGTMTAVLGADDTLVETVCKEISAQGKLVEPANYNCPGQLVISGTVAGVQAAAEELKKRGAKRCIPLEVSAPFHSSLLKPAADRLKKHLDSTTWNDPAIPYVANVDCSVIEKKEQIVSRLVDQVWKPVRWTQSLQKIFENWQPKVVVEVGPGQVVSGHVKKIHPTIQRYTTDSLDNLRAAVAALAVSS